MEDIVDLIATDASAAEISDKIKEVLFGKSSERIEALRPQIANSMFGEDDSTEIESEGE